MKRLFLLICAVLFASTFVIICVAHTGGTDAEGGHYNRSTGEYHYHHGYPAHQHDNGVCPYDYDDKSANNYNSSEKGNTINGYILDSSYVDAENLEDVIFNEFEGVQGEDIRDVLISNPDCEILKIGFERYIEYESLRDVATKEYGEDIADTITSNRDLIILTPQDIKERHYINENNDTTEDNITENKEGTKHKEKTFLKKLKDDVVDFFESAVLIFCIFFPIYGLPHIIKYFISKQSKKRSRNIP